MVFAFFVMESNGDLHLENEAAGERLKEIIKVGKLLKKTQSSYLGSSKTREFEGSFCYRRLGKFAVLFLAHS